MIQKEVSWCREGQPPQNEENQAMKTMQRKNNYVLAKEISAEVFQVHCFKSRFWSDCMRMVPWRSSSCVFSFSFCLLSVQLIGYDILKFLSQFSEAGPHHGVQSPALLHDVIHHYRADVGGVHLIALLHTRDNFLQRL